MTINLPYGLGLVSVELLLVVLPALVALVIFILVFGGDKTKKLTKRRIEQIKAANNKEMTPQEIVSIRRSNTEEAWITPEA